MIHLNGFISNPNPYFWILIIHLIGYGLDVDWIHFWIIQIVFWVGFWLGLIQVEPRQFRPRLSKVDPSPRRVESSGPKSNWVGMDQSQAKSFRTKVEPSHFRPKSRRVISAQCRAEQVQEKVKPSKVGTMLSRPSPGRCRVAWADIEPSEPKQMSRRVGPGRCRYERAQTDVEPSGPGPMSSQAGPN